jgi:hypothetical protein
MQTVLQNHSHVEGHLNSTTLTRGITTGLIDGLTGMIRLYSRNNGMGLMFGQVR